MIYGSQLDNTGTVKIIISLGICDLRTSVLKMDENCYRAENFLLAKIPALHV
jgi:hypothetical protein